MIQTHLGPWQTGLSTFEFLSDFAYIFKFLRNSPMCNVHPTAEPISATCITPWRQYPWCVSFCGDNIRSVHHSAETISVVCITPRGQYPWCASLPRDNIRDVQIVHHSPETICVVCITPWRLNPWCASLCGDNIHGLHHSVETISMVCIILRGPQRRVNCSKFLWSQEHNI